MKKILQFEILKVVVQRICVVVLLRDQRDWPTYWLEGQRDKVAAKFILKVLFQVKIELLSTYSIRLGVFLINFEVCE